jgi:hypothetical protein
MRCYFIQHGHIAEVGVLAASSDEDAIKQSVALFCKQPLRYTGFEVWDRTRFVHRHKDSFGGVDR